MSARTVGDELHRIERAALAQLVENVQAADRMLAALERDAPLIAPRVFQIRETLYRLPPGVAGEAGATLMRPPRASADDELASAWGEPTDDKGEP